MHVMLGLLSINRMFDRPEEKVLFAADYLSIDVFLRGQRKAFCHHPLRSFARGGLFSMLWLTKRTDQEPLF